MEIEIGQHTSVTIGIVDLDDVIRKRDAEPVVQSMGFARFAGFAGFNYDLEDARRRTLPHREKVAGRHDAKIDRSRRRVERADEDPAAALIRMRA